MSLEIATRQSLIVAPAIEPIDLEHARLQIKAVTTAEDLLIQGWIAAARQYFEEQTGRQIITATWELWLDAFPTGQRIELPHPPLQEVLSVEYIGDAGSLLSFSDGASPDIPSYAVKAPQGPYATRGWIEPNYAVSWPTPRTESGSVRIQYKAGYGDTVDDVPDLIKTTLCFLVGHFEQFRSAVHQTQRGGSLEELPFGVAELIRGFKYSALPSVVPRLAWPWV